MENVRSIIENTQKHINHPEVLQRVKDPTKTCTHIELRLSEPKHIPKYSTKQTKIDDIHNIIVRRLQIE